MGGGLLGTLDSRRRSSFGARTWKARQGAGVRWQDHQAGHPDRTWAEAQLCSQLGVGSPVVREGCNPDPGVEHRIPSQTG